ncbi:MAG: hypothetical protein Q8920_12355 [Bacillota bacterium]|nr:hypothetical protein [Bacillota bacterium]
MVKVIYGKKGSGKTKSMIDNANNLASSSNGNVVFIDDSNQLMYSLKHEVRFINITDFPVLEPEAFLGFICGVVSSNYDVDGIFIDGLTYIVKKEASTLKNFFDEIASMSEKYHVKFFVSINGDNEVMPEFLKEYE